MANKTIIPNISKDFLFHTIPVIYENGFYIFYSPFTKQIFRVKKFNKNGLQNKLGSKFFGPVGQRQLKANYGHLSIVTTTDCNLRCQYCFANGGEKPSYITKDLAFKAIEEMAKKDIKELEITFFGGEPTLNMEVIRSVINYCKSFKKFKSRFDITTNGIISEEVAKFLIKNNFNITISVDGPPKIQNILRPTKTKVDATSIVERSLSIFSEHPDKVKARVTVTNTNVDHMPEIVRYLSNFGIKYVHFAAVSISGRAKLRNNILPRPLSYCKGFIGALDEAKKLGVSVTDEGLVYLLRPADSFCSSTANTKLIVTPDGSLSSCLEIQSCDSESMFIIGKYDENKKLFQYYNDRIKHLKILNVDKVKDCSNCPWKYICSSGCPIRNIIKTKNMFKPNKYYCVIKKHILHEVVARMYKQTLET